MDDLAPRFAIYDASHLIGLPLEEARACVRAGKLGPGRAPPLDAEAWYERGGRLEASAPEQARAAYERALELAPRHAEARVNLGRLLHDAGDVAAAEHQYRLALAANPNDATATFNLGVALEDLGRTDEAIQAYQKATALEPDGADAHYNLARLYERLGRRPQALRSLNAYWRLTRGAVKRA